MGGLPKIIAGLGLFLLGLTVYAGFVAVYFFLALPRLDGWIKPVFDNNKILYAVVALALICVQGIFLQIVTGALFRVVRRDEG